jgi:hypothetical protein
MKIAKKLSAVAALGLLLPLSSQAMTQQQYQNMVYAGAAAVAWGSVGTVNYLLNYFISNKIPSTAANWGNIAAVVCGAGAAGLGKSWNPPADSISKANVALAVVKAGAVIGPATICRWTVSGIATAVVNAHNDADAHANALSPSRKTLLNNLVKTFENQKGLLTQALQDSEDAQDAFESANRNYNAENCHYVKSLPCVAAGRDLLNAIRDVENARIYARQMAWDIGQTLYKIGQLEGEPLPRPTAARPVQHP